jgi:hypothetical protein
MLQENHIDFKSKVKLEGREVDFLIGNIAIEIDGHEQVGNKNHLLADAGYVPIHITNDEIYTDRLSIIKLLNYYVNRFSKRSV